MKNIGFDKLLHFIVCLLATIIVAHVIMGVVFMYGGGDKNLNVVCGLIGALFALCLGVGKEGNDWVTKRQFDFMDLAADGLGAFVGFLLMLLV